jgi:hypothetical protein
MSAPHDDFLERVIRPLRQPETLAPDFDARLMASVHAETKAIYPMFAQKEPDRPWLRRPRAFEASPLAMLAMAAGFAGLVALGTLTGASYLSPSPQAALAAPDTVHVVRFVIAAPDARAVALVGDFNGWSAESTPLVPTGRGGVWSVSLPLEKGQHEYAFIVDGKRWVADPAAPTIAGEFDTPSSVVAVGTARCSAADGLSMTPCAS